MRIFALNATGRDAIQCSVVVLATLIFEIVLHI